MNETLNAIREAKAAGATTVVNLAPFTALPDTIWPSIDIVIVNETEGRALTDLPVDTSQADVLAALEQHPQLQSKTIVATFGGNGAYSIAQGQTRHYPAQQVEVIDTVGAGDSFCGYLAATLDQGQSLDEAMRLAVRAGGLACTIRGAQLSIPHKSVVNPD